METETTGFIYHGSYDQRGFKYEHVELEPFPVIVNIYDYLGGKRPRQFQVWTPYIGATVVEGALFGLHCSNTPYQPDDTPLYHLPWPHLNSGSGIMGDNPCLSYEGLARDSTAMDKINGYFATPYRYFLGHPTVPRGLTVPGWKDEVIPPHKRGQSYHVLSEYFAAWEQLGREEVLALGFQEILGLTQEDWLAPVQSHA